MSLSEVQNEIDQWIKTYGVRYFSELTNLSLLMEEVGELSRLIGRKYGEQSFKNPPDPESLKEMISDELSDVMFVLVCLANQMDIDLEGALRKNLDKKTTRDKDRHINNEKLKNS